MVFGFCEGGCCDGEADLDRCRARVSKVSPVQVALGCGGVSGTPVRSAVPSTAPRGLKRLRLMRMSQDIPVVSPSGETQWARPRQGTWVNTTQVESDDVGQEGDAVFDPVESDDEVDSLVAVSAFRRRDTAWWTRWNLI